MCSSRKYISIPTPWKVNINSKGEGGFKSTIFLKESMKFNWNFQRGGGLKLKDLTTQLKV